MNRFFLVAFLLLFLASCARVSIEYRRDQAAEIAEKGSLKYHEIKTDPFTLAMYYREGAATEFTVYIEGDGFAYVTPTTLSSNPTPTTPTALILAVSDPTDGVIYLGRPCQYIDIKKDRYCSDKYWSTHRFADEVISSFDQALNYIRTSISDAKFHLVGYSGGGAVAVILAARRTDVESVRTVAGYLDHVALNRAVGVAPLTGSLDPIAIAPALRDLPQVHYFGLNDRVIPAWVSANFVAAIGSPNCARSAIVNGADHVSGWAAFWNAQGHVKPKCL